MFIEKADETDPVRGAYIDNTEVANVIQTAIRANDKKPSFSDVHPENFFYDAVGNLTSLKAINGYSDGTFRPNASLSKWTPF